MTNLIKKFTALFKHDRDVYVNAARINDIYKKLERGANQINLVNNLKLDYIIVVRRGKDTGTIANIDINSDQFKPSMHNVFVKLDQLNRHKELMKRLKELPDINNEESDHSDQDEPSADPTIELVDEQVSTFELSANCIPMRKIKLADHERFKDVNDQVVEIEVRGKRTKDQIYFKAKDVGAYFEMDILVKRLLQENTNYTHLIDYIVLEKQNGQIVSISDRTENPKKIKHSYVYLTIAGFIRVVCLSRSANANVSMVFDWILNLVYTHQFGSDDERSELAQSLFKTVLNDKIAGLYYIDLGTCDDLYDSMNIDTDTYPPHIYGSYRIGKFGLSDNISTRVTQHKNKKNGYGQWCNEVLLKWLIILSPSQLAKAELILSSLLRAEGFTFEYTDDSGKDHHELIMFDPVKEHKVKKIYKRVMDLYPSKENELYKIMDDATYRYESEINQLKSENKIDKLESTIQIQSLSHQVEMLSLKLELAQRK